MIVLIGFALLAGAGTAVSPCVLPVLPALLSAGAVGGRRRPLGIVIGLTVTFTVAIVGLATVVDGVGLGTNALRYLAVAVLLVFGIALALPDVAARLEAPLSRVATLGPRTRGDGFVSGLVVGGALGFVYTPCAGPILAAVISVSAASGRAFAVGLAYALGSAAALFALTLGGRKLFDRVRAAGRGPALQRALGGVMVLTAVAIVANLDVKLNQQIAQNIPDVNLTAGLEHSHAVESRLNSLRGPSRFAATDPGSAPSVGTPQLPVVGQAPGFVDTQRWFNTPGGRPLTLAGLRGRTVLIDFWTYTCINCLRTLPYLKAWDAKYRNDGLTIVGVHSPEFSFEHDAGNVANAIAQFGIRYPVIQDNNLSTWNAWGNQYWPAEYLVDANGQVRRAHFGEGEYAQTEAAIRALLVQAGATRLGSNARARGVIRPSELTTPETYLGAARAAGFVPGNPTPGVHDFTPHAGALGLSRFSYDGPWRITPEAATALGASSLQARVRGKAVYIVASSAGGQPRAVRVLLDGHPIGARQAGADVHQGVLTVSGQRLYTLTSVPRAEVHLLTLRFAPGVSGYSFTFG